MTHGDQRIPLVQYLEVLQLLRYLSSQQDCELRHCYYSHCSNGQLRHEENMAEALLNGQVNLQLAATQTGYQSAKIMPYPRSSAGLETASRFLVTAPISSKFRLPSQLTSGKHLTAPAKVAGTLRFGAFLLGPKSQNHHNFHQEAHGRRQKSKDKRSELFCFLSEITHWARCTYTREASQPRLLNLPVLTQKKSSLPLQLLHSRSLANHTNSSCPSSA